MNLVEKLSREIERVAALRERWRVAELIGRRRRTVLSGITMMTAALDAGHTAAGGDDRIKVIEAIKRLEGF